MRRMWIGIVGLVVVASAIFAPGSLAAKSDPAAGIAAELDEGYMREIIEDITAIGSSRMGFRTAGTPEDRATARYIVGRMADLGLRGASVETVPVDMWRFREASLSVDVGGRTLTFPAASQGGVPPTPRDGLTGEVLFVGEGTAIEYDALEARGIRPEGKLVLVDWDSDDVWTNHVAMEARARGALGTIITVLPGGDYYQGEGAIGSFDSVCDPRLCGSFITISKEDALTILGLLEDGPVRGTMRLVVEQDFNVDGYNTIAYIPGSKYPEQLLVFNAHHDAWFESAIDCTSCVAAILAIAKAIVESGYEPERTIVFSTSTGEEWGVYDTYYDWLYGAFLRITETHRDWQTRAVALLNVEGSGFAGDPLEINVNQEYRSFLMKMLGRNRGLLPYGFNVWETYSWNELWTYAAAGVPGFTFSTSGDTYSRTIYHTNLDTIDKIDFRYLRQTAEFVARVMVELDRAPLMPFDFGRRVDNLADRIDYRTIADLLGPRDPRIAAFRGAMDRFSEASAAYEAAARRVPRDMVPRFHAHGREATRLSLSGFTALNVWDFTVYPHEQLEMDAVHLGMAIEDLRAGRVQGGLRHLEWWVGQSWYIPRMSYGPFLEEMLHHDAALADGTVHVGGPKSIAWGGQGHLPPYWDLWRPYRSILEKASAGERDFSAEIRILEDTRAEAIRHYGARLSEMLELVRAISTELEAAAALAS